MRHVAPIVFIVVLFVIASPLAAAAADDEGGNESGIAWASSDAAWDERGNKVTAWDAALKRAASEKKPLMLLVHRTWCGACKSLR